MSYNAARHLDSCLESLAANGVDLIVVVDNASVDGSREVALARGARWLPAGANLGYGTAANLAAASVDVNARPYLLVTNPDVEARRGAIAALAAALDADPRLGAVGPRLLNVDGTVYPSARAFPSFVDAVGHGLFGIVAPRNRFTRRYRRLDWDHRRAARVDWISGACFLVRRAAWAEVGGFDPGYFMYMEDVDLCWRLRRAGWEVGYEPAADVVHVQGVSADRHPYRMLVAHHRSLWRFACRTATGRRRAALPVVAIGLAGRLALTALHRRVAGKVRMAAGDPPSRPLP